MRRVLLDGEVRDQVTIAALIGVDRNTAADVIRRLAKRALLERPDDPKDKRTKLAKITQDGKKLVEKVQPGMVRQELTRSDIHSKRSEWLLRAHTVSSFFCCVRSQRKNCRSCMDQSTAA